MPLERLQRLLADIYDADVGLDVRDFLVTARGGAAALARAEPAADEVLLLRESPEGLDVTLYVDEAVLRRLADADPFESLADHNLADLCTVLEGVSHFQYLVWSAQRGRAVSLLELETQAEVDKFVGAFALLARQHGRVPPGLHARLFERVGYLGSLEAAARARYETANRLAARYCRRLQQRYLDRRAFRPDLALRALRAFWRLPHRPKLNLASA